MNARCANAPFIRFNNANFACLNQRIVSLDLPCCVVEAAHWPSDCARSSAPGTRSTAPVPWIQQDLQHRHEQITVT